MKRREHINPDLTPIIDIVFLILVFFMVSSTFKKDEFVLFLTLPTTNNSELLNVNKPTYIELSKYKIAYNGKEINFSNIEPKLNNIKNKEKSINLRIDTDVSYGRVTKLFDLLNKYKLNNLALESTNK